MKSMRDGISIVWMSTKYSHSGRSKLEDRIRAEVRENIDKVAGNVTTLEKLHKSTENQVLSTLGEIRDIKQEIGMHPNIAISLFRL